MQFYENNFWYGGGVALGLMECYKDEIKYCLHKKMPPPLPPRSYKNLYTPLFKIATHGYCGVVTLDIFYNA